MVQKLMGSILAYGSPRINLEMVVGVVVDPLVGVAVDLLVGVVRLVEVDEEEVVVEVCYVDDYYNYTV